MSPADFKFGFWVRGDCHQPRRIVDAAAALAGYAGCDSRCELDRESYLSAFQFGADFREHLERTGSVKGFAGACWASWLWFDVDREGDLLAALVDARRLCAAIVETLGIDETDVLAFLSGGKGFHVGIPTCTWTPEPGRDFHRAAKHFAGAVAGRAGAAVDGGVYDRVRCFRAPNSRHPKTGRHKRYLTVDELLHLGTDAILKLAAEPAEFDLPEPTYRSEPAGLLWREAADLVNGQTAARAERLASGAKPDRLNRVTLEFIRDGAGSGDRHRLLYSAAANLAEFDASVTLCHALLSEAAFDCGLPPKDVQRAIENGWASVQPGVREVCHQFNGEVVEVRHQQTGDAA